MSEQTHEISAFTFINSICEGKPLPESLILSNSENGVEYDFSLFNTFLTNRSLSHHWDTTLIANEMNMNPEIPKTAVFAFLSGTCSKKKRFSKWTKKLVVDEKTKVIMELYGYTLQQAKEAMTILPEEEIKRIMNSIPDKGGMGKIKQKRKKNFK